MQFKEEQGRRNVNTGDYAGVESTVGPTFEADDEKIKIEVAGDQTVPDQVDVVSLQKELAEQRQKAEDYLNRLVRLQADFDNFRKRVQKEKEELVRYASAQLCEALLPVLDNFQFALAAKDEEPDKVAEGVELIKRQLEEVLSKEGLIPVAAVGEEFDPTRHEAVLVEETIEYPDNTVLAELRRGYVLNDKLIRPAMVKVAKSSS